MSVDEPKSVKETSHLPRFPLSKVKKIAKCDSEYIITSNAAIVATAFATELFVQSLTEDGLSMAHLQQGKKSKNKNNASKQARLTLDNIIESVQRKEQYYFLEDVINKKMFSKDVVSKNVVDKGDGNQNETNQSTLSFNTPKGKNALEIIERDELDDDEDAMDIDSESEHAEGIVEGIEEEEEEDKDDNEDMQEDEETELQREMNNMHNVEDIDADNNNNSDEDDEGLSATQRLIGRAETVEEVEPAEE